MVFLRPSYFQVSFFKFCASFLFLTINFYADNIVKTSDAKDDKISKANKTTKVVKKQTPILKDDPQSVLTAVAQTQDGRSKRTRKK
jgi:hypothetical protein